MSQINSKRPNQQILCIFFLQIAANISILFNIPVARQVIGFTFFTFVPGYALIKLLKMKMEDVTETFLFSVGLSIAFLMLGGLLINEFFLLFGVSQPLSIIPLIITFNNIILLGGVLLYLRSEDVLKVFNADLPRISPIALLFACLPILSIVGAMWVNAHGNNMILLFMIMAISLLFIIGVFSKKLLPSERYPFAVLMIAIAILYHSSFISNYIVSFGSDVPVEYFVFKTAENSAYWNSIPPYFWDLAFGRINAMLSVTVLPTVYSSLLNIDSTWMFKIVYPLLFCLVPLGLYQIWHRYIGQKYAFIAAFLFMAQETFYTEMLGLNRQIIGELFFVLLMLVVLNKNMNRFTKTICFVLFSFGLVTSHYGLSEIFLFFISFAFISLFVVKKSSRNITVSMILSFFVVMFSWYIFTSGSATFDVILEYGDYVYRQLGDFFNPASRGQAVLRGLGLEQPPTIWNLISRAFAYATEFLIVVGFAGLLTKRVKAHFEKDYFMFTSIAMAFLAALILVPGLAGTMNMTRFYHVLLFFLAPLCVLGAEMLTQFVSKQKEALLTSILLAVVLVPYFLFQTGFMYEVAGSDSWSIPLSGYRMSALRLYGQYGYTNAYSAYGAQWLSKNVNFTNSRLYSDGFSRNNVLTIYGMVYRGYVNALSNVTIVEDNGAVYLSTLNVVHGMIPFGRFLWNTSELTFIFDDLNLVYTNGGSVVYKNMS